MTGAKRQAAEHIACRLCGRQFRTVSWSHLVHIHGFDAEHPIDEYKHRFALRRAFSPATIRRMKSSLAAHFEREGRRWTRHRIREELRRLRTRRRDLSWPSVFRAWPALTWSAKRLFGSWERAIRGSGLCYDEYRSKRTWTPGRILEAIQRFKRSRAPIHYSAARSRDYGLVQAAVARWGSWAKALEAAGVDREQATRIRRWTRDSIIEAIKSVGRVVTVREIKRRDSGLHSAAVMRFGTWRSAVQAAGLHYPERNAPWKWPRERVIEEIRRRAQTGLSVRAADVDRECRGLIAAGYREFGTWTAAVGAAGIRYPPRGGGWKWPMERVVDEIRSRVRRRQPIRDRDLKRSCGGLWAAGRRLFGTWRKAVLAAGVRYPTKV